MCMKLNLFSKFSVLVFTCMIGAFALKAQQYDCNFANPVIKIDFGDDRIPKDFSFSSLKKNYNRTTKICPDDGEFSFISYTKDCFLGNWISFYKDQLHLVQDIIIFGRMPEKWKTRELKLSYPVTL